MCLVAAIFERAKEKNYKIVLDCSVRRSVTQYEVHHLTLY